MDELSWDELSHPEFNNKVRTTTDWLTELGSRREWVRVVAFGNHGMMILEMYNGTRSLDFWLDDAKMIYRRRHPREREIMVVQFFPLLLLLVSYRAWDDREGHRNPLTDWLTEWLTEWFKNWQWSNRIKSPQKSESHSGQLKSIKMLYSSNCTESCRTCPNGSFMRL